MYNWGMGPQLSSTSLLQTLSQYNYPNASQQYLEMLNILRKMSPSVMVYPELNKSMTDDTFNPYNLQKTSSSVLSHSGNSSSLSGLQTAANTLSAIGDLGLYGINPLKHEQRNNTYCASTFTNSPLSAKPYVNNNSIMTTLEQYKPAITLDNALRDENRPQMAHNFPTSSSSLASIPIENNLNNLNSHKPSKNSPVIPDDQISQKAKQISTESVGAKANIPHCEEKKIMEGKNKAVGRKLKNIINPPITIANDSTKSHWHSTDSQSNISKIQPLISPTNSSSHSANVGIMYPSTKSVLNTITQIQLPSTNMGIVYPNNKKTQSSRNNEVESTPPSKIEIPKQYSEISPSISLTAVRGNISSKSDGNTSALNTISNYKKKSYANFNMKEPKNAIQLFNKKKQTNSISTGRAATSVLMPQTKPSTTVSSKGENLAAGELNLSLAISKDSHLKVNKSGSYNVLQASQAQTSAKKKPAKIQPRSSPSMSYTNKPITGNNLLETRNKPITQITSANELKKCVEINSSNLSAIKHALNIRPVENKNNPTGTGLFIIEANVNEKKVAIGTPTKSGGGTTITKISAPDKRKIIENTSKDDAAQAAKRQKIINDNMAFKNM